jgi:hypothetical protein
VIDRVQSDNVRGSLTTRGVDSVVISYVRLTFRFRSVHVASGAASRLSCFERRISRLVLTIMSTPPRATPTGDASAVTARRTQKKNGDGECQRDEKAEI